MKRLWVILFVIIGCSSTKVPVPLIEFEVWGDISRYDHSYRGGLDGDGVYYCRDHKRMEEVRFKLQSETNLDKSKQ